MRVLRHIPLVLGLLVAPGCENSAQPRRSSSAEQSLAPPRRPAPSPTDAPPSPRPQGASKSTVGKRIDLELTINKPRQIAPLDLTVTLLVAKRIRVKRHGKTSHRGRVVIRFEGGGRQPQEVSFGPETRVVKLFGHDMAVFGGTVLTIFPPGQSVMP